MKRDLPALSCLLLLLLLGTSLATAAASPGVGYCCHAFTRYPIPQNRVKSCERTGSSCPKPAVIIVTARNLKICANPQEKWVQDLSERFNCR